MKLRHHDLTNEPTTTERLAPAPGRRTRSESLPATGQIDPVQRSLVRESVAHEDPFAMHLLGDPLQMRGGDQDPAEHVHAAATHGIAGAGGALPFLDQIQASFGPEHDVSHVQAHVDGAAAEGSVAMGARAFATGNHVAFAGAPDLHTAAHEAAHVVQQRGGVQLAGGVGASGDSYEQHADRVADAVVRGEPADELLASCGGNSSPAQRKAVQRFESKEHKRIGDDAADSSEYDLGPGTIALTHGDIVALSGDYFPTDELTHLMSVPMPVVKADGASMRSVVGLRPGTADEIIYALFLIDKEDPRFLRGGIWEKHSFSDVVKKNVDARYYRLAAHNDDHFARPEGKGSELSLGAAGGTYRQHHERALMLAYKAGRGEVLPGRELALSLDEAMITEAAGQHYLTDNFAGGHLTTPRTSIGEYWNKKYPDFGQRFIDKVVRDLSIVLKRSGDGLPGALPRGAIEHGVRSKIGEQLAGKPLPSLGDILSLVMHDQDNAEGVYVENDVGDQWIAYGDGKLDGQNFALVKQAVQLGNQDVRNAYFLGQAQKNTPLEMEQIQDQVRQMVAAPASPSEKYAPEQLIPRMVGGDEYQWQVASLDVLWDTPIKKGSSQTFGMLLMATAARGTLHKELEKVRDKLPAEEDPLWHSYGELYPWHAFDQAVLKPLEDPARCKDFLFDVAGLR